MSGSTMAGSGGKQPHILVFPYPAQGHTLPLLDLTYQLSLHNLTITVLTTPKNHHTLSPLLSTTNPSSSNIQALTLPFPSHPKLPPGVENVKDIGNKGNYPIMAALTNFFQPIIEWFESHPNPPVAILSDFFLGWTLRLANQLNIPRIAFFSSGAFLTCVSDYLWNNVDRVRSLGDVVFPDLPGSPVLMEEHLPTVFRLHREGDPDSESVKEGMIANTLSWGCVFNSFDALECVYLEHLKRKMGHDRVFAVGPLSLVGPDSSSRGNPHSDVSKGEFTWLDRCPDGSVLYVCFGSQKLLSRAQTEALAFGLEKSGARFIWVVKTDTTQQAEDGYGLIPSGFEERVTGWGRVVKGWASQVSILSHKAVGGFLSHCGWNSLLEGIGAGVMILAWPMEADQFVNARLVVEDMGMAVRVCEGANTVPDAAKLGRVIADSMSQGDAQVKAKAKAKELRDEALAALKSGGSSMMDLDRLVNELFGLK